MKQTRIYHDFTHRQAQYRICCEQYEAVKREIISQRRCLESYIQRHSLFRESLKPVQLFSDAPEIAQQMSAAAMRVGTGPMAAVAGAMAQSAAEAGLREGALEAIVDNGGDIYVQINQPLIVGLYPGQQQIQGQIGFAVEPDDTPLAICSSSGKMGHSMSLGLCDLATVVSKNAALADAAATEAANGVHSVEDMETVLEKIHSIEGVRGVLIVKDGRIGMAGHLPKLVKVK